MNIEGRVQIYMYVKPETRERLRGIKKETGIPQWRLIELAVAMLYEKQRSGKKLT